MKWRIFSSLCCCLLITGCAGTQTSKFGFSETNQINVPVKDESCYDASVLLGANIKKSQEVAKKVLIGLDSTIEEETPTHIKAQRNRYVGFFVGSGGEILIIQLKEISDEKTFATATTQTGFVGGAGMKAWSCQIVDELIKMIAK